MSDGEDGRWSVKPLPMRKPPPLKECAPAGLVRVSDYEHRLFQQGTFKRPKTATGQKRPPRAVNR